MEIFFLSLAVKNIERKNKFSLVSESRDLLLRLKAYFLVCVLSCGLLPILFFSGPEWS